LLKTTVNLLPESSGFNADSLGQIVPLG